MKVAVVGAGLSGLVAAKECLEQGFDVDVFEALPHIGGQWAYRDPDPETGEVMSSIYKGVILNSCRDTSSFTDFPLDPKRYPPFMDHKLQLQYLQEYADFYDIPRRVQLSTKVLDARPLEDGTWTVKVQALGNEPSEAVYDAVMACSGNKTIPNDPPFSGKEDFKGDYLHSHWYRSPARFEGKRVVVIGLGASAVDIACELVPACKEVHLVTRRGAWVVPRFLLGKPAEAWDNRLATKLPKSISETSQLFGVNLVQGKHPPALKPDHGLLATIPLVRGEFMERVNTGKIILHRAGVEHINANSIKLTDGTDLEADAIVACTGFQTKFPYLPNDILDAKTGAAEDWQNFNLYKLVKPINYSNIFVVGFAEAAGPAAPLYEAQARWAANVLANRIQLPSKEQQVAVVKKFQLWQQKETIPSERHNLYVLYLEYVDDLLRPLGAAPSLTNLLKLLFTSGHPLRALRIMNAVYMKISASGQWRLLGHGAKPDWAMETTLRVTGDNKEMTKRERVLLEKLRPNVKTVEVDEKSINGHAQPVAV